MMRAKDIIKILENHGFILSRYGKHAIFKRGALTVAVPHEKVCSKGLVRRILKQASINDKLYL